MECGYDPTSGSYHLKFIYCCQSGIPIVKGVYVTKEILAQKTFKSVKLVYGRALTRTADEGIKFMQKPGPLQKNILMQRGTQKSLGIVQWKTY